jgi:hypothetical protein
MKHKKRNRRSFDKLDAAYSLSRRQFMTKLSFAMAAAGVAQSTRLSMVEELARKVIPQAHASDVALPQRMIFIGVRSGIPVMPFGAPQLFASLTEAITPNVPFAGNQFTPGQNGLHFSPDAAPLMRHQENLLITQGVATEGGHTTLFNFWEGGRGQGQTSPIITLASRNTSSSVIPGVHFTQSANGNRVVNHRINDESDLLTTHNNTFRDNFKKATLAFDEDAMDKILQASVRLSRRQALRLQASMTNSLNYSIEHSKAAELLGFDFSEALNISNMGNVFTNGINGTYRNFANALGHTVKAMSFNLVNSATIELSVGDWHGLRDMSATRPYYQEVSEKLAATVDYLKATPDIAGPPGTTLWDTTTIVIGSEFNRNDSTFGRDNGDGGAQGTLILSKKVRGGYYGSAEYLNNSDSAGNPRILRHSGVDRLTGQTLPSGQRNSTRQLFHTVNNLVGNNNTASEVITAYLG